MLRNKNICVTHMLCKKDEFFSCFCELKVLKYAYSSPFLHSIKWKNKVWRIVNERCHWLWFVTVNFQSELWEIKHSFELLSRAESCSMNSKWKIYCFARNRVITFVDVISTYNFSNTKLLMVRLGIENIKMVLW